MLSFVFTLFLSVMPSLLWQTEGRTEAERDIIAGTMKWKIYGYSAGLTTRDKVAKEKMQDRFGVELEAVAQCEVTDELIEHATGYNERIREEVEGRHGVNAIRQVWREAHQESRPAYIAVRWASKFCLVAAGLWVCRRIVRRRGREPDVKPLPL
ncbi:MAG: hypothetical protein K8U57_02145 [Planctomycetes bacterium]|nr:hypothetical protein [Planctomycetota bacterium]